MQNIKQQLSTLSELQAIDKKLHYIIYLRGDLPREIESLETDRKELEDNLKNFLFKHDEAINTINLDKQTIKEKEADLNKYEKQKESISNSREYDALIKAIESHSVDIELIKKKIREKTLLIDDLESDIQKFKDSLEQTEKNLEQKKSDLKSKIEEQAVLEKDLLEQRKVFLPLLDSELLEEYDKLRTSATTGLGASIIEKGACGVCCFMVNLQKQIDVASKIAIEFCDYCGSIFLDATTQSISETVSSNILPEEEHETREGDENT